MDRFGDYRLEGEIGRGGMGIIYRAHQLSLNRDVALKMILAGPLNSSDFARRLRVEAEAAARLDHPHIVPIYEVGEHEGQPFYAMRLVEGLNLAQALKAGPLRGRGRRPRCW
ncbi:MAG: protein kinase [Verrucomicrobia bacterium]|nr:protein kinase [Verrucomicrobiota bacterium]